MQATLTTVSTTTSAKAMVWTGHVISALPVLFLIFDAIIKLFNIQPVVDASKLLGLPVDLAPTLGLILLVCIAIYLLPRTAMLGAVLLTGYLGGAISIQARVEAAPFSLVFPIILGAMLWVGLFLRDERVRGVIAPRH